MTNIKTVPNQKVIRVTKEICDKQHTYAAINIAAMEEAARNLDAGAFKLWIYFAKNQENYQFALSSKAVEEVFGMKIKQYNNAIKELQDKGYVNVISGNIYCFSERAVNTKKDNVAKQENSVNTLGNNCVNTKKDNAADTKKDNELLPLGLRNNTNNTYNNTNNNTEEFNASALNSQNQPKEEEIEIDGIKAKRMSTDEATEKFGWTSCMNRIPTAIPKVFWINKELVQIV